MNESFYQMACEMLEIALHRQESKEYVQLMNLCRTILVHDYQAFHNTTLEERLTIYQQALKLES
jgi:hypothetical protein